MSLQAQESGDEGAAEKGKKKCAGKYTGAVSNYLFQQGQEKESRERNEIYKNPQAEQQLSFETRESRLRNGFGGR